MSKNRLQQHFPMIRTRLEVLDIIHGTPNLHNCFTSWTQDQQEEFINFCTGEKGIKILYDSFFTIVFFEQSTSEFHAFPDEYLHYFKQKSNTGLELNLLQEYYFIPLDIFRKIIQNKGIKTKLDAWLIFLASDKPEQILALIEAFPEFRSMYQDIYELCRNIEGVMGMFSKELQELDRNTVEFMIDEMQNEINRKDAQLNEKDAQLNEKDAQLKRALVDEEYRKELLKSMNA